LCDGPEPQATIDYWLGCLLLAGLTCRQMPRRGLAPRSRREPVRNALFVKFQNRIQISKPAIAAFADVIPGSLRFGNANLGPARQMPESIQSSPDDRSALAARFLSALVQLLDADRWATWRSTLASRPFW
jgi:hypothetical protein